MSFKALKVWRALKRNPGMVLGEVATDLGWQPSSVSQMLIRLRRDGSAYSKGPQHSYRWWATDEIPVDGRGLAKGSFEALEQYCPYWKGRLEKAKLAKPRKAVPKPKPAIALEKFWPMSVCSRADSTKPSDSC